MNLQPHSRQTNSASTTILKADQNQARGLGQFAIDFINGQSNPDPTVLDRMVAFHRDSVACAVSALSLGANAPDVLRQEALQYVCSDVSQGVPCFGSCQAVFPEKAVVANCSAVREWDANGTNFGYNPAWGHTEGEFGHNDFYPVAVAAAQLGQQNGRQLLLGMLCLDEIRGRLAEVFALRKYKIDHVLHGGIASAAVYGAMLGASAEQIESAIGMVVSHYVPYRAIRAGHQLSDSKGASAALSAEMAVVSVHRAMAGFVGPKDILRNPQAVFCWNEPVDQPDCSPFELRLSMAGGDFAIMGMHFKLGLYEHQSAGAIQGLLDVLSTYPDLLNNPNQLQSVRITIYEPAFSIIGDPAKRDPKTRQSADHSMVYIIATLLRKAYETRQSTWQTLMLLPDDYNDQSLHHPLTRQIMEKIVFEHGGDLYDQQYPDGIPTSLTIEHQTLGLMSSGRILYPAGHARYSSTGVDELLDHKFYRLTESAVDNPQHLHDRLTNLVDLSHSDIASLYSFEISNVRTS